MPAVPPRVIVDQIIEAIQESGGVAAYVSETVRNNPRKFVFSLSGNTYRTLTAHRLFKAEWMFLRDS